MAKPHVLQPTKRQLHEVLPLWQDIVDFDEEMISQEEGAKALGVHRMTFYRWHDAIREVLGATTPPRAPITWGEVYLIREAMKLVDALGNRAEAIAYICQNFDPPSSPSQEFVLPPDLVKKVKKERAPIDPQDDSDDGVPQSVLLSAQVMAESRRRNGPALKLVKKIKKMLKETSAMLEELEEELSGEWVKKEDIWLR